MRYFKDIQIGDKVVTRGRTVTETDFVLFAAVSGDWHPIHTDAEFAGQSQFGERILHGLGVLTLASGLLSPEHISDMAFIAFYGMDKVRFTAPVKIGDTIHVEWEIVDKQENDKYTGVVSAKQSIRNQKGEEVAFILARMLIANGEK